MKIKRIIRDSIFAIAGILVLIFNEQIMEHVHIIVGCSILLFMLDELIENIVEKEIFTNKSFIPDFVLQAVLALVLFLKGGLEGTSLIITTMLWGTWTIMREVEEIKHKVLHKLKNPVVAILNAVESIVVIYFTIGMLLEPHLEHHAHVHIILLGIELLLEVIWPILDKLTSKKVVKE